MVWLQKISIPPMEGICPINPPPHPSGNSNLVSNTALNFWVFETPPPPSSPEFSIPSVGGVWIFSGKTQ